MTENSPPASFTPGPWEACNGASLTINESEEAIPDHVRRRFVDEQGRRVTQFVATCNTNLAESRANAHLIAAAPDLLAALKAMMDGAYGNPAFPDENALVEEEAAKAIAKAEGRNDR